MNLSPRHSPMPEDLFDKIVLADPVVVEEEKKSPTAESPATGLAVQATLQARPDEPWYQLVEGTPTQFSLRDLMVLTLAGAVGLTFGRMMGGQLFAFVTGFVAAVLLLASLVRTSQTYLGAMVLYCLLTMYAMASLALFLQSGT